VPSVEVLSVESKVRNGECEVKIVECRVRILKWELHGESTVWSVASRVYSMECGM
jgi:hypothetical protein